MYEFAGKWTVTCFNYLGLPYPLPELLLRSPKLTAVPTPHERIPFLFFQQPSLCFFLDLFLFFIDHYHNSPVVGRPQTLHSRVAETANAKTPKGNLKARQLN